jgi:hypothetical protein
VNASWPGISFETWRQTWSATREAYSHEVSSAGFWPGDSATEFPAFYSSACLAPKGFADAQVAPKGAYSDQKLQEFLLPYEVVQSQPRADEPHLTS